MRFHLYAARMRCEVLDIDAPYHEPFMLPFDVYRLAHQFNAPAVEAIALLGSYARGDAVPLKEQVIAGLRLYMLTATMVQAAFSPQHAALVRLTVERIAEELAGFLTRHHLE